jgi:transcriptional regulator with XRE-family HTH domain
MVLLRRVIGDALRARRQSQHRTLREVSTSANVSLGYLSEIERGQKEASSELLSSICDALGAQLSEVLREVSDTMALAEQMDEVLVPVEQQPTQAPAANARPAASARIPKIVDGKVSVAVRHDGPLKTTLRATRTERDSHDTDLVYA